MPRNHPTIPVLDLAGTPAQIGAAHGESQRERIREYADTMPGWLLRTAAISLTETALWARWAPQLAHNQQVAPALVDEMRGIARGAGQPIERIFLLNSLLDLVGLRYLPMAQNFGCSTFAVVAEAGTGATLVGQTYDMPDYHERFLTVLRLKPNDAPQQLVFTFAGIIGAAGLNEAGLGLNTNFLSPTDGGIGTLHSVVVRQVLNSPQLADALTWPVVPPRAGGAHYLLADRDGNVVSIETTGRRHAIAYPEGNALGHTNHYLAGMLHEREYIRSTSIGSSLARYTALRRFLRDRGGRLDRQALMELTRNHTAFPRSICAHGAPTEPEGAKTRTVSAMVAVPAERVLYLTQGCACESEYGKVEL